MDELKRQDPILKNLKDSANRADFPETAEQRTTNLQQPSEPCVPPLPQQRSTPGGGATGPGAGAATAPAKENVAHADEERGPLFSADEANRLRAQWDRIQVGFVDEPRKAVTEADQLVATAMKRLSDIFQDERQNMERQWDRGDQVSTEDLRQALRRYRSFFGRLLSI